MKVKEMHTSTYERTKEVRCDFCDAVAPFGSWDSGWNIADVDISFKKGKQFPECGSGDRIDVDACPKCFEEKILPKLREMAIRPLEFVEWSS